MPTPYELGPVTTIAEVLTRPQGIQDYIAANGPGVPVDGVGCFNNLYAIITNRVWVGVNSGFFGDAQFMKALDVAFANRYFDALRAGATPGQIAPRPWKALIDRRADHNVEELQFAAAGVNAHIDFDLAAALLSAWRSQGGGPDSARQFDTYLKINQIFAEEMQSLRHRFETACEQTMDRGRLSSLLTLFGNLTVDVTRPVAWGHASHMWALRHLGPVDAAYMEGLAVTSGVAGELLLQPLP